MSAPGRIAAIGVAFLVGVALAVVVLRQDSPRAPRPPSAATVDISSLLLRPASAFFGETISADASVFAAGADGEQIAVHPDFRPYSVVATTRVQHELPGHRTMLQVHWTLQCLRVRCLAPDGQRAIYTFPVSVSAGGRERATAAFQPLLVVSRLASGGTRMRNEILLENHRAASEPNAAVVLAGAIGLIGAAALLLFAPFRRAAPVLQSREAPSALREAIDRLEGRRVGVSRAQQRGALDHLARVVAEDDGELADDLRGVAWGESEPDDASIARLLERARRLQP